MLNINLVYNPEDIRPPIDDKANLEHLQLQEILIFCLPKYGVRQLLNLYEEKKIISKSFLYFYLFLLALFSYNPVLYFVSRILNLFLYAFKLFHLIFLSCVFLT